MVRNIKLINIFIILIINSLYLEVFGQFMGPKLVKKGDKHELIVNEKPFLILGGELGNSTATTMANMESVWPKMKAMNLNTILVPVYWELIEPEEGKFDFELLKNLISESRKNDLKIVFLWFGSWKNSMSSHAPSWVKKDQKRFPRVQDQAGRSQEILSSFSKNVLDADTKAYVALMQFIKDFDAKEQTVIMMQVENEIGMLPTARDYQALAEKEFNNQIPAPLISYLQKNKENLVPEIRERWRDHGYQTKGNWETVFGKSVATDEIFMAYFYSLFANHVSDAGKKVYPIPTFVNAALNRPGREPGAYPSAGPLPHVMDIWKAGGNSLDILVPDFYNPDYKHWCDLYTRQGDPLLVPEHAFDATVAAKALFIFGHYEGLGFSPFHIEGSQNPSEEKLGSAYKIIGQLAPLLNKHRGSGKVKGVLLSKAIPETIIRLGDYEFSCKHDYTLSWNPGAKTDDWPLASVIIIQTGEDEFYVGGSGVVITSSLIDNKKKIVGLLKVDEGQFENGQWKVIRHMNGDQTHQGRHINISHRDFTIQRFTLYQYD